VDFARTVRSLTPKPAKDAIARSLRLLGEKTSALRMSPTYQIVGAQRSGSSSLYEYIVTHPLVGRALVKEVHYFDVNFHRGIAWYKGHFPTRAKAEWVERLHGHEMITGEATPYYMAHPTALGRLAEQFPDSRIIVVLRDPIDRAYSHYNHEVALGHETLSFEKAVEAEPERLDGEVERMLADPLYQSFNHQHFSYVTRGMYADQLDAIHGLFQRERVHVLTMADLQTNSDATYAAVLRFLGLPSHSLPRYPRHGARTYPPMARSIRDRLRLTFEGPNRRLFDLLGTDLGWNDASAVP
jgi:hypothetical protein